MQESYMRYFSKHGKIYRLIDSTLITVLDYDGIGLCTTSNDDASPIANDVFCTVITDAINNGYHPYSNSTNLSIWHPSYSKVALFWADHISLINYSDQGSIETKYDYDTFTSLKDLLDGI